MENKSTYLIIKLLIFCLLSLISFPVFAHTKTLFISQVSANEATDVSITTNFKQHPIKVSASKQYAGSIYSITWKGKEFLNSLDHGRQLQSSISFNGMGGCLNPTEGGSITDGNKNTSSSILKEIKTYNGNTLFTSTQAAYWMPPGYTGYPSPTNPYCGYTNRSIKPVGKAQNTTRLSNVIFKKWVKLGAENMPNVIEYITSFNIDQEYQSVLFETLTAHMPIEFSEIWSYDLQVKKLTLLDGGGGYPTYQDPPPEYDVVRDQLQDYPIIVSTPDKQYAMGIYSPNMKDRYSGPRYGSWEYGIRPLGYGRWKFIFQGNEEVSTSKWNLMYRAGKTTPGSYPFKQYVILGNITDVKQAMDNLHNQTQPNVSRQEASQIISNRFSLINIAHNNQSFTDVSKQSPYFQTIESFLDNGITSGCATNPARFCPDRLLTRAEAATYILQAAKFKVDFNNNTPPVFTDVPTSHPLFQYVQLFAKKGFTIGCGVNPTRFCPDIPIRRQDLETFINRVKPKSLPADFNADGHVDIFDYNILLAGFGTKYDIFDYNELIANYGK